MGLLALLNQPAQAWALLQAGSESSKRETKPSSRDYGCSDSEAVSVMRSCFGRSSFTGNLGDFGASVDFFGDSIFGGARICMNIVRVNCSIAVSAVMAKRSVAGVLEEKVLELLLYWNRGPASGRDSVGPGAASQTSDVVPAPKNGV